MRNNFTNTFEIVEFALNFPLVSNDYVLSKINADTFANILETKNEYCGCSS